MKQITANTIPCAAALVLLVLGGCSEDGPPGPPDIAYGVDACSYCAMIISDERYAAAAVVREGDGYYFTRVYDDIGCLLDETADGITGANRDHGEFIAQYVVGHDTQAWLNVADAVFIHSRSLYTPMASGVAAFPDESAAQQLLEQHPGRIIDLATLQALHREGALGVDPRSASDRPRDERDEG